MATVVEDLHPGTWVLDLCDAPTSMVARVRGWASRHLVHLGDPHRADVLLIVSELLTNAFEHGNGPQHVQLWRSVKPCAVRIEVADFSRRLPVVAEEHLDPRGRGLLVVDRLAAAWGICQDTGRGKTVWAHVQCDGDCRTACGTVRFRVASRRDD
jgi:anti-sigma regulatory factor (Ser/Thr protein kinase)